VAEFFGQITLQIFLIFLQIGRLTALLILLKSCKKSDDNYDFLYLKNKPSIFNLLSDDFVVKLYAIFKKVKGK
jgi:hypothetical protein